MTEEQMQAACDLLYRHWTEGSRIDALPDGMRPVSRAEGYAVQAYIERHTRRPLYGWKIAATSEAGQAHIGVDGPLAGRILAERVIEDGGHCKLGNNLMRAAELEFAFCMAADLPPREEPYSEQEVLDRVASLHPAIELPDSRYEHFESAGLAQLLADNACAHLFILGPPTDANWREMDLAQHRVEGIVNGRASCTGLGANVLGNPRTALTWLANELSRNGLMLKAGQVVTTGTCVVPITIAPGDRIEGNFGLLGRVAISID